MSSEDLERFRARPLILEPGARGQSWVPDGTAQPLILLLGVTALVLLTEAAGVDFELDGAAMLFAAAVALGTVLLFGSVPALRAARTGASTWGSMSIPSSRSRCRLG